MSPRLTVLPAGRTLLVAAACAAALASAAAAAPPTPPAAPPSPLTDTERQDLATMTKWLRDETLGAQVRREAATMLLNKSWPEAEAVLLEVLSNKDLSGGRLAVVEAIGSLNLHNGNGAAAAEHLKPQYVGPLIAALGDASEPLRKASARALAVYKDRREVLDQLRGLMLDRARAMDQRRGAVAAFALMPPSFGSIDPLIQLLDDPDAALRARAIEAVRQLTLVDLGDDVAATKRWWAENKGKSPLEWAYARIQSLTVETHRLRTEQDQLTRRLVAALDALYQGTPEAQQPERLLGYLNDPLKDVRVLGVQLVDRMMAAGTTKPPDAVRKAVLDRLGDESAEVRVAAADVTPYLGEPKAAAMVLAQFVRETDPAGRRMMVSALGRLRAVEAVAVLIEQLAKGADAAPEAARALGLIGAKGSLSKEAAEPIVKALIDRHGSIPAGRDELREAVIRAMADVADPRFAPILLTGLGDESASIRLASAQGLGTMAVPAADQGKVADALIGRLAAEADRGVRLALVGALGSQPMSRPQLEALFGRTSAANEPDESVRKRAGDTLLALLKSADKQTQLAWASQLENGKDAASAARAVELLGAIEQRAGEENWPAEDQAGIMERLADGLVRAGRPAEAAPRYEKLFNRSLQAKSERTDSFALKYCQSLLAGNRISQAIGLWQQRLAGGADAGPLADAVLAHVASLLAGKEADRLTAALSAIEEVRRRLGPEKVAPWSERLDKLAAQATAAQAEVLREQVRKSLDQMTGADKALQAAGRARIEQLGPAAVPVLLAELEAAITGDGDLKAREQAVIALLANSPVKAADYDPDAPKDKKLALLAAYRQRWAAAQKTSNGG